MVAPLTPYNPIVNHCQQLTKRPELANVLRSAQNLPRIEGFDLICQAIASNIVNICSSIDYIASKYSASIASDDAEVSNQLAIIQDDLRDNDYLLMSIEARGEKMKKRFEPYFNLHGRLQHLFNSNLYKFDPNGLYQELFDKEPNVAVCACPSDYADFFAAEPGYLDELRSEIIPQLIASLSLNRISMHSKGMALAVSCPFKPEFSLDEIEIDGMSPDSMKIYKPNWQDGGVAAEAAKSHLKPILETAMKMAPSSLCGTEAEFQIVFAISP